MAYIRSGNGGGGTKQIGYVSIPTKTAPAHSSITVSLGIPGARIIAIYGQFKWSSSYAGVWHENLTDNQVLYYTGGQYVPSTSTTITANGDEFTMGTESSYSFSLINSVVVYEV